MSVMVICRPGEPPSFAISSSLARARGPRWRHLKGAGRPPSYFDNTDVASGAKLVPAKSKAQQMAASAALAAKRGDIKKSELKGASRSMAESMSEQELHDMAATKRKGKPGHVARR
jgi:hypothetical protein